MTSLATKKIWITGAGTGIGAGAALELARAGAEVILSGRRAEPLEKVAAEIAKSGGNAHVAPLDVANSQEVARVAAEIGPIDILLANAGLNVANRALSKLDTESWDRVINVNLNGVYYPVQAVLPTMRARGEGQFILISSWAGKYASRLAGTAYTTSKHGVVALSESINMEECANGIRSTVIMPGEVATEILKARPKPPSQLDIDRMLQVEDLARTVRFVAESPAHMCLNEILISPTWNRTHLGFDEL